MTPLQKKIMTRLGSSKAGLTQHELQLEMHEVVGRVAGALRNLQQQGLVQSLAFGCVTVWVLHEPAAA